MLEIGHVEERDEEQLGSSDVLDVQNWGLEM
jgi:hypothetical protein